MDWSLMLLSQGIESTIEHRDDDNTWWLLVAPDQLQRARSLIRVYRAENLGWGWRQNVGWTGPVFHWGGLLWCWVLILFHWLAEALDGRLGEIGAMSSIAFGQGEWYRLFTAVSLHADLAHLAANASTGLIVFGLAMARYGAGTSLLAAFIAGAAGNLAGWFLHASPYRGLGASGMVMGGLGMLAVQSAFVLRRNPKALRQVSAGLIGGFLLFVLVGLNPASDVVAHAGGFVAGLLFGLGLALLPDRVSEHPYKERISWTVLFLLFVGTWALAWLHR
ncbi:MAG: rhomboid family intramembrane serine protease [Verrucomicrobiia bacterium]